MTIRERFASYTNEEIEAGIKKLQARIAYYEKEMETYKKAKNLEMFKATKALYDDDFQRLMDAECALSAR